MRNNQVIDGTGITLTINFPIDITNCELLIHAENFIMAKNIRATDSTIKVFPQNYNGYVNTSEDNYNYIPLSNNIVSNVTSGGINFKMDCMVENTTIKCHTLSIDSNATLTMANSTLFTKPKYLGSNLIFKGVSCYFNDNNVMV
jgi:hypothetical protein